MVERKKYTGRAAAASGKKYVPVATTDKNIQARKQAAGSMKKAGVQSLSGLSGSQGQVARFKTEQNNLRNEYNNKDTSDERKKEILQDLRGVSRDLNNQNKAAAINQIIREFGPDAVTNTGNIKGREAGARFQQLRGNPDYFQDGLAGLNTFVGIQRAFKEGDRDLFKKVHPNPFAKMLGMGLQAYKNLSPLGLVQNLGKIRKGEKLIPVPDWMKRNMSESPSRMKDFYSAYIDDKNKDIAIAKGDAVPLDPQFQDVEEEYNELWNKAQTLDQITGESSTGDPTRIAEDKDLQDDMERSLLNQYSLLQDDSLAETLVDETQETDLFDAMSQEEYDQELKDRLPWLYDEDTTTIDDYDVMSEFPKTNKYAYQGIPNYFFDPDGDFEEIRNLDTVYSDVISDTPKLGQEIRSADFSNLGYKDGGYADSAQYKMLKLINDTMNDG